MNARIDTLRGLACVLLVLYHVIGADPRTGLGVADGWLRWGNDALAYLRMPLFTFLSGVVYGLRPFQGDSRRFLLGKVRRLLVPMLVVGTLFALVQDAVPGTNRASALPWWQWHWLPVAHFWFLESLFWVFLLVWALERWGWMSSPRRVSVACLGAAVLSLVFPGGWYQLSIEGAFYLLPYFMLGLTLTRLQWFARLQNLVLWGVLLGLIVLAGWQQGVPTPGMQRRVFWVLVLGMALCLLAMAWVRPVAWLMRVGSTSYAIYLFHVFFTAAARIGLLRLGVETWWVHIPFSLMAGVLGPMLIEHWASAHRWSALLLLGKDLSRLRRTAVSGD